jgi:hypothetical protein
MRRKMSGWSAAVFETAPTALPIHLATACAAADCRGYPATPTTSLICIVEAVDDCFTGQAIDPTPIEDVANIAEQDDGGIFILVLGKNDGSLSGPRCPSSAKRIGNGDERAPVIGGAIAQLHRHGRV